MPLMESKDCLFADAAVLRFGLSNHRHSRDIRMDEQEAVPYAKPLRRGHSL
jgi:hypothetical protein